MSDGKSPGSDFSSETKKKSLPSKSSGGSPPDSAAVGKTTNTIDAKTVEQADNSTNLTRKRTQWVFATTCYAFGILKRDFSSPIDEELLAIIKTKLDDEPGFHNDTLDFGNNHFHDKLELVVRETWDTFLNPKNSLDILDHTEQCNSNHDSEQQHQSISTDDNNSNAIEQHKANTPNSSSCGDSALNEQLDMISDVHQKRKVYLGGLSGDIEEADLREYFKDYGTIVDINILLHKDTGKRRGFAFVEYDDPEPVDKIVSKMFHTIKNRRIEAKKAIPKKEMDARKRVDQRGLITDAMMVLHGGPAHYLWDGLASSYGASGAAHVHAPPPLHAPPPPHPSSNHAYHNHLDHHHHHYPHHYHAAAHYSGGGSSSAAAAAANAWLLHGGGGAGGGSSGGTIRGAGGGANGYSGQVVSETSWAASVAAAAAAADYGRMPMDAICAATAASGGIGPMRSASYGQHGRSYRPYAAGGSGSQRARNFK